MKNQNEQKNSPSNQGFFTYTKKVVTLILVVSLFDLQLSYILAFLGHVQIAESLSSTIATTVIGVMIGYFSKALFETFLEKREERLNHMLDYKEENYKEEDYVN